MHNSSNEQKTVPALCYEYPLRPNFTVQLVLPRDLTDRDLLRLTAFIASLVTIKMPSEARSALKETQP